MRSPDRQQILDAWESLDEIRGYIDFHADGPREGLLHAILDVEAALPERPKKTMDEIGWDQDKNFLWEAEHGRTKVAMLGYSLEDHAILTNKGHISPRHLTPTGRRYKLVLDDHPEYLETEQDYEDAPDGTVVAMHPGGFPLIKHDSIWKSFTWAGRSERMSGEPRRVLRWGWG